jgi:ribose transport system permease protein
MANVAADVITEPGRRTRAPFDGWGFVGKYGALLVLAALIIAMTVLHFHTFATKSNAINVLSQSALTAIIAMGLTFPLVAGDFDLSIGYTGSCSGVIACTLMVSDGFSIATAFAVAVAFGAAVGAINGLIVTKIGVNPLVATLGVGTVVVGINYAIAGGTPVALTNPLPFLHLTLGKLLGVPYPVYVMFGLALVLWLLLNRTVTGQSMQAVGGNPVAARLSGLHVDRVRVTAFVIAGACAAIAGVLLASTSGQAASDGADGYLLTAFAACFFGTAVLSNGQFHIVGTLVGVLTVGIGFNAIALIGLATYYQFLFQGALLIVGVGVGTFARRRAQA